LNRWLYARATSHVVTVSEAIRGQYIASSLLPADRVVALPGGVSLRRFHPAVDGTVFRRQLGIGDGEPVIGLVAGLRPMKGHGCVVDAARQLAAAGRTFRVLFIGAGALETVIRRAIAEARLEDRVSLIGFVPDLPGAIAACDVAVYAALESEGMSRVVFEYLASGKPVVASRIGVVPEALTDGENALLVPPGEAGALADALARLLDDDALRGRLGAAGAEAARARLSAARVAEQLSALYARLATGGRRRAP
jgi:glycosyltransferase involved in cell wall biosynthesis